MRSTAGANVFRFLAIVTLLMSQLPGLDGMIPSAQAAPGTGLQFNGSNQYVTFGQALNATDFTLEAWVKRASGGATMTTGSLGFDNASGRPYIYPVLTKGMGQGETPANVNMNYFLGITATGVVGADFEDNAGGVNHPAWGTTQVTIGEWHHVAATYGGGCWALYVDGNLETLNGAVTGCPGATPEFTSIQHAALAAGLGSTGQLSTGYFAGVIDEARVWNVVRTPQQIRDNLNLELLSGSGLLGRWGLNEGTGATAANSVSGGASGTLTNGPTWAAGAPGLLPPPPPAAPGGLAAAPASATQVDLGWTDNSGDEAGFEVERSTLGAAGPFAPLAKTAANAQAYRDLGLSGGNQYCYRVRAYNAGGYSAYTDAACATTLAGANFGLDFGSSSYVTFGPATSTLGLDKFTLETWFKRTGSGATAFTGSGGVTAIPLITKGLHQSDGSAVDCNYFLGISQDAGHVDVLAADFEDLDGAKPGTNHPVYGTTTIQNDTWYHAAVTYDGTTWGLYLNGQLETALAVNQTPRYDSIQQAGLGAAMDAGTTVEGHFQGVLDEVRIWNFARTQAQIQDAMNAEIIGAAPGLVVRYGLNEGSGLAIHSSSGTSLDGTIAGAGAAWAPGAPVLVPPANLPPAMPTLGAPGDGAAGVVLPPTLDVTVSDPENDPMRVTFYGKTETQGAGPDPMIGFVEIGRNTGVASGASSSVSWPGLTPNTAYEWYVTLDDGQHLTAGPIWSFTTAAAVQRTLTLHTAGSGSIGADPAQSTYDDGAQVTLTAVPATGWTFDHWSGCVNGAANPTSVTMNGDQDVTATFTAIPQTLSVQIAGSGTVTKSPDQASYLYGDTVTLTATPAAGYHFTGWSGDASGTANPTTVTMNGSRNVTATFARNQYRLTVTTTGSGTVSLSPAQETYDEGQTVWLTATPAPSWYFRDWSGDASGTANPIAVVMSGDRAVNAAFTSTPVLWPSNFHGEVQIQDGQSHVGQTVAAYVPGGGAAVATATIEAPGTYSVDVPPDAAGTPDKEGGAEGEVVTFKLGGRVLGTGRWHSNTSVHLALHPPQGDAHGPYTGREGAAVTFSASAADGGGDAAGFAWDWNRDGVFDATGPTPQHAWNTPGTYPLTLLAVDAQGGEDQIDLEVTVTDVPPSSVSAGGPYTAVAGEGLTLHAAATCPSVDTCVYAWDLDADGAFDDATGPAPTVVENNVGSYAVTVKVTDDEGSAATASAALTIQAATHSIALAAGWNLVSFNLAPANSEVAQVLSSMVGKYDLVYAWNAHDQKWQKYQVGAPEYVNSLIRLDRAAGFWIHVTTPGTLTVVGNVPDSTDTPLYAGWNLTGYPAKDARPLPDALQAHGVGTDFWLVYAYHVADTADQWKLFDRSSPFTQDLPALSAGWGYWIQSGGEHTWVVDFALP